MGTRLEIRIINKKSGDLVENAKVEIFDGDSEVSSCTSEDGESFFEPDAKFTGHLLRVRVSKGNWDQEKTCRLEGNVVSLTFEMEEASKPQPSGAIPRPGYLKWLLIPAGLVLAGLIVWVSGFHRGTGPRIVLFKASPSTIQKGETSALEWKVENAETAEIASVGAVDATSGCGTNWVKPPRTTTYTLVARNADKETKAAVKVEVSDGEAQHPKPPLISKFGASRSNIRRGDSSKLTWRVEGGAQSVWIIPNGEKLRPNGNQNVTPQFTTTYTLFASNSAGKVNKKVTINVSASRLQVTNITPEIPIHLPSGPIAPIHRPQ